MTTRNINIIILSLSVILLLFSPKKLLGEELVNRFTKTQPTDTTTAKEHLARSMRLYKNYKFDSAIYFLNQAIPVFKNWEQWDEYYRSRIELAHNNIALKLFDEAESVIKSVIKDAGERFGTGSIYEAMAYNYYGDLMLNSDHFDEGISYYNKAEELFEKHNKSGEYTIYFGPMLNSLGIIYARRSYYGTASEYLDKAKELYENFEPRPIRLLSALHNNLGNLHQLQGKFQSSLDYYQSALELKRELYDEYHPSIALTYDNISGVYVKLSEYNKAIEYINKSIAIEESTKSNPIGLASSYVALTRSYGELGEYNKAIGYGKKALIITQQTKGENKTTKASVYSQLSLSYTGIERYDLAIEYYKKSIDIYKEIYGEQSKDAGLCYFDLGHNYWLNGASDLGMQHMLKGLEIIRGVEGENGIYSARLSFRLAQIFFNIEQYEKALEQVQKSIGFNVLKPQFDNIDDLSENDYLNGGVLWTSIALKASILDKQAEIKNDLTLAKESLSQYKLVNNLINKEQFTRQNENDRLTFRRDIKNVYDSAISMAYKLYAETKEQTYRDDIFYFLESSKSALLSQRLSDIEARKAINISDSLLTQEYTLKSDISYYLSELRNQQLLKDKQDSNRIKSFEDKLFEARRRYESLVSTIEQTYPKYYSLKYKKTQSSISEVQDQLSIDEGVVEYFYGENTLYSCVVTKNDHQVYAHKLDHALQAEIDYLIKFMREDDFDTNQLERYKKYTSAAYALYRKILSPIEKYDNLGKLTILPDGKLGYLLFETLLTSEVSKEKIDFRNLDYLINKLEVRYAYSSGILSKSKTIKNEAQSSLISFAPAYSGQPFDSLQAANFGQYRNAVVPLEWNQKEADRLSNYFDGNVYSGANATESQFKKHVNNFSIIHLATHAFVDDNDPMNSKLVFSQKKDSLEDGSLHAFELYNMDLNAELAVLSACQTGDGRLAEGEGIMSLARAFSYAGVPSVTMSYWQVDDQSTSELMDAYFQNLSEGMLKPEALRKAKLDFLKTANVRKTHPFFWSGFVVIGDDSPLRSTTHNQSYYWYILAALALVVGLIYLLKRKNISG